MYCYNHLRNVWVKNVLNLLNDFMRGHLNESLDEIAPELRVSPNFITFARAFDKEFSLCANWAIFFQNIIGTHSSNMKEWICILRFSLGA